MFEHFNKDIFDRLESNVRSYCRRFPGTTFQEAKGAWLSANDGRRFLDLLCGAGSLNYGHNNRHIIEPVIRYLSSNGIVNSLDLHTEAKGQFLADLEDIILKPRSLDYKVQFPGPTGTNAVEAAFKLARKVTGRQTIAAFKRSFHGMTLGALAATSNKQARHGAGTSLNDVVFWPFAEDLLCEESAINLLEKELHRLPAEDRPAGVIVELVQGEGGLRHASPEWTRGLSDLCRKSGILLIVDDIQAGCGRTGSFFSFDGMQVVPDIVLLSKSLSGFGAPLSIVLLKRELDAWAPGEHNGTFRGNNLAFVGASAALTTYWKDDTFKDEIKARAEFVHKRLSEIASIDPHRNRVRGRGLMIGIEFEDVSIARKCSEDLFRSGIISETCGEYDQTLKLLPPVNIDLSDLSAALERIEEIVGEICLQSQAIT